MKTVSYSSCLLPTSVSDLVRSWLAEDIPSFDIGGLVVGEGEGVAHLFMKQSGVVCGRPFFDEVFRQLGCCVTWCVEEGSRHVIESRQEVAIVRGPTRALLQGERSALNCLARCSGIATRCRDMVEQAQHLQWKGRVAGTRKTTPGFRIPEKYAMLVGGADTHRMDLSSMVMLKDNHVIAAGSITKSVQQAKLHAGFSVKVEVECKDVEQAREAVIAGADVVMLDNMKPNDMAVATEKLKKEFESTNKHFLIEASGGITKDTVSQYFLPHVDIVSLGSVTQGCPVVDFSLKILKQVNEDFVFP